MKIISIIHTVYIFVISVMLAMSAYYGSFKGLFTSGTCYAIHIGVSVLLSLLGLAILVSHLCKSRLAYELQVLWWLPQLIAVVVKQFTPDKKGFEMFSLYHWPMGIRLSPEMGWEGTSNEYLFIQFNLVALTGIIVAILTLKKSFSPGFLKVNSIQAKTEGEVKGGE